MADLRDEVETAGIEPAVRSSRPGDQLRVLPGDPPEHPPAVPVWAGAEYLAEYLKPIGDLRDDPDGAGGEPERAAAALRERGQTRPVLVAENGVDVVGRQHLVDAARTLGWTHLAVRLRVAEEAADDANQLSLADALAETDPAGAAALARRKAKREAGDEEIEEINAASADPTSQWVGLPEYVAAEDAFKVVISCEREEDREALFDLLGISTIHKGTRGTLSVWWPDRPKKDLASLRFVALGEAA